MSKSIRPMLFLSAIIFTLPFFFFFVCGANQPFDNQHIEILNPQSNPNLHGNWTVHFKTDGDGILSITNLNYAEVHFEKLLAIKDGEWIEIESQADGNTIYADWSYAEGQAVYRVDGYGSHTLEFSFGNTEYAHNIAEWRRFFANNSDTEQSTDTTEKVALSLNFSDVPDSKWLIMASWESTQGATGQNGYFKVEKDGEEQALYVEAVRAVGEYISYFFPQVHEGDGGYVTYNVKFQAGAGTTYIRNVRIVAMRLDNLVNTHYNHTFNGTLMTGINSTWGAATNYDMSIIFTPSTAGEYLILAGMAHRSKATGSSSRIRLNVDNGAEYIPVDRKSVV